jgi:diadenosine tetraphosphate (Ap4A) HIT family hydrolase
MPSTCTFCISEANLGNSEVKPERILAAYEHWWLLIQIPEKLAATVQAAGLLVLKRHVADASNCVTEEFAELPSLLHPSSQKLCNYVGSTYTGQMRFGANIGTEAGQTIGHVHIHLLPVSESDPPELKVRSGIGGAFEALRQQRLQVNNK